MSGRSSISRNTYPPSPCFTPSQFGPNSAWIAFSLTDKPLETQEGSFDLVALMDAASCVILGTAPVPNSSGEPSQLDAKQLLKSGHSRANRWPQKLIVPISMAARHLSEEAEHQGIKIERVSEADLEALIGDAKRSFMGYFRSQSAQ